MKKATRIGIMLFVVVMLLLMSIGAGSAIVWAKGNTGGTTARPGDGRTYFLVTANVKDDDGKTNLQTGVATNSEIAGLSGIVEKPIPISYNQYNHFRTHVPDSAEILDGNLVLRGNHRTRTIDGQGNLLREEIALQGGGVYISERASPTADLAATWNGKTIPALLRPDSSRQHMVWEREGVFGVSADYFVREMPDGTLLAFSSKEDANKKDPDPDDADYNIHDLGNGLFRVADGRSDTGDRTYYSADGKTEIEIDADEWDNFRAGGIKLEEQWPSLLKALEAAGMDPATARIEGGKVMPDASGRNVLSYVSVDADGDPKTPETINVWQRTYDADGDPTTDNSQVTTIDPTTGRIHSSFDEGTNFRTTWNYQTDRMTVASPGQDDMEFSMGTYHDRSEFVTTEYPAYFYPPGSNQETAQYVRLNDGHGDEHYRDPDTGRMVKGSPPESIMTSKQREALQSGIDRDRAARGLRSEANMRNWDNILGGKFMDSLGKYFKNDYQGFGGYFSWSYEEKWMKQWRDGVHRFFCETTVLLGGIDCWTSALCSKQPERAGEHVVYVRSPGGGLTPAVSISMERSEYPTEVPQADGTTQTLYLYKIEYYLVNSHPYIERDMHYQVTFQPGNIKWFDDADPNRIIAAGSADGRRGGGAVVTYSRKEYTSACIEWSSPPVRSFTGSEYTSMCTDVKIKPGSPTTPYSEDSDGGVDPDTDGDGLVDSLDDDDDGDGILDVDDDDSDNDGIPDDTDNCPDDANADQQDMDGNGVGDACDIVPELYNFY